MVKNWGVGASISARKQMMPTMNMPGIDSTIVRAHFSQCGGKGGELKPETIGRSFRRIKHQDSSWFPIQNPLGC